MSLCIYVYIKTPSNSDVGRKETCIVDFLYYI